MFKLCLEHFPSVKQLHFLNVYPELHHLGSFGLLFCLFLFFFGGQKIN